MAVWEIKVSGVAYIDAPTESAATQQIEEKLEDLFSDYSIDEVSE
jgi:hypothetical protein